jgi:hypothetical protein
MVSAGGKTDVRQIKQNKVFMNRSSKLSLIAGLLLQPFFLASGWAGLSLTQLLVLAEKQNPDTGSALFKSFAMSLLGALMAMWGILLFGIIRHAFANGELWAWNSILYSTISWFVIDEFFSIYYQVFANAIGNIPLLFLLIFPLVATRKDMVKVGT